MIEFHEQRDSHASSSHEPSLEPTKSVDLGEHSVYTHFPKDRNCEICQRTKITRAPCTRRIGTVVPRAENFGDLITADHEVLSEWCESRNNHRYAVVVQDLSTQWIQSYPCKAKTSQETTHRSLQKFLEPNRKPKVIYTDNSLEFGMACEELSWKHCTSTPHRSETNGIAERAVRRVKEGTSAILLQSGLNASWWADSKECYTYLLNVTDLLFDGKTLYERRFGKPYKGPIIPFGSLAEYYPISAKDQPRIHRFGNEILLDYSLDTLCTRREFGRVTNWLQTMRSWKRWTHRKSTQKDSMQKKLYFPKKMENSQSQSPTLLRDHPILTFWVNQKGLTPPILQDSFPDAGEARNDFWSFPGNFIYHHHVEPRVKLYSPREESSLIPLKYIDVSRSSRTNLDVMQELRIEEYCNIDGSRDLSGSWTGFTQFSL